MYDIVSLELEDTVIEAALASVIHGNGIIPVPGAYTLMVHGGVSHSGAGAGMDTESDILVIIGHGTAASLSGYDSWAAYKADLNGDVEKVYAQIYIVACSTADEGPVFLYGNIAGQIKASYPAATVWASVTPVYAPTFVGDWQILEAPPAGAPVDDDTGSSDMDIEKAE